MILYLTKHTKTYDLAFMTPSNMGVYFKLKLIWISHTIEELIESFLKNSFQRVLLNK